MNSSFLLVVAGAGMLLAGCATFNPGLVLEAVGPGPASVSRSAATNGTLAVYSAHEVNADFNARDPRRPEYSDYRIYSADGQLWREIHNNSGTMFQRPQRVELPPGSYRVTAPANGYGWVTVPVIICAGRDTILHLEGGFSWPAQSGFNQTNAVRLPDGEIVGWKGSVNLKPAL
jgi:hypothetical protein